LPPERWTYVRQAERRGLAPESVGFLPYAMLEEYGVLVSAFRDVRAGTAGGREGALAAGGLLAHLAGDASVPLHVTRHHHGWVGRNPHGFTRRASVHRWFESELVKGIDLAAVRVPPEARERLRDVPAAVAAALAASLALVPRVYETERAAADGSSDEARDLVRERLAAGATLLARLWRTAWTESARSLPRANGRADRYSAAP